MGELEELRQKIIYEFSWLDTVTIENEILIVKESYEPGEDEKNSDDCCDAARENGEMIISEFPVLEIVEYYCHRHKYAIVELKLIK